MNQKYDIGEMVTFQHNGQSMTGRVFGAELVDDSRRRRGWHYVLHAGPLELVHVHESQIVPMRPELAAVPISDEDSWGVMR